MLTARVLQTSVHFLRIKKGGKITAKLWSFFCEPAGDVMFSFSIALIVIYKLNNSRIQQATLG